MRSQYFTDALNSVRPVAGYGAETRAVLESIIGTVAVRMTEPYGEQWARKAIAAVRGVNLQEPPAPAVEPAVTEYTADLRGMLAAFGLTPEALTASVRAAEKPAVEPAPQATVQPATTPGKGRASKRCPQCGRGGGWGAVYCATDGTLLQ